MGFVVITLIGASYLNARWMRADYDELSQMYIKEMAHLDGVASRAPSPRFIFAGGSSVIHAVDPKLIAGELGAPVINMAISNRLASDSNYFDYLLPYVRRGDIVVYSNHSWWVEPVRPIVAAEKRDAQRLADRLWVAARIDMSDRHSASWPLLVPLPDTSLVQRLRMRATAGAAKLTRQRDSQGGLVQCPVRIATIRPHDAPTALPDGRDLAELGQFVQAVAARGGQIIFFETRVLVSAPDRERWARHRHALRSRLKKLAPMITAPDVSIFSTDHDRFCDSASHIGDEVRGPWSRDLAARLRQIPQVQALVQSRSDNVAR